MHVSQNFLTMQTILKHIEDYYRHKGDSNFDRVTFHENYITIWFEKSDRQIIDKKLVKENNELIAWLEYDKISNLFEIIIYNTLTKSVDTFSLYGEPDSDGYEFYSFAWIDNSLFCIYQGDHDYFYIQTIAKNISKHIFVRGDAVRVFESFLTFQNYGIDQPINKVDIPQLSTTNQFSEKEAKAMNIMPLGLGLIYYTDHNFYRLD